MTVRPRIKFELSYFHRPLHHHNEPHSVNKLFEMKRIGCPPVTTALPFGQVLSRHSTLKRQALEPGIPEALRMEGIGY